MMQPVGAAQVEKRFVDGDGLHEGRQLHHHAPHLAARDPVLVEIRLDDDRVRAGFQRLEHGRQVGLLHMRQNQILLMRHADFAEGIAVGDIGHGTGRIELRFVTNALKVGVREGVGFTVNVPLAAGAGVEATGASHADPTPNRNSLMVRGEMTQVSLATKK